jgi:hypothetical protein
MEKLPAGDDALDQVIEAVAIGSEFLAHGRDQRLV